MLTVALSRLTLIAPTTVIHCEVLRALNAHLPALAIPKRSKVLVVIAMEKFWTTGSGQGEA